MGISKSETGLLSQCRQSPYDGAFVNALQCNVGVVDELGTENHVDIEMRFV